MSTEPTHDPLSVDRENARLAAIGLAVWTVVILVAVALLILFGDAITGFFV